jgi:hypothetical protein
VAIPTRPNQGTPRVSHSSHHGGGGSGAIHAHATSTPSPRTSRNNNNNNGGVGNGGSGRDVSHLPPRVALLEHASSVSLSGSSLGPLNGESSYSGLRRTGTRRATSAMGAIAIPLASGFHLPVHNSHSTPPLSPLPPLAAATAAAITASLATEMVPTSTTACSPVTTADDLENGTNTHFNINSNDASLLARALPSDDNVATTVTSAVMIPTMSGTSDATPTMYQPRRSGRSISSVHPSSASIDISAATLTIPMSSTLASSPQHRQFNSNRSQSYAT